MYCCTSKASKLRTCEWAVQRPAQLRGPSRALTHAIHCECVQARAGTARQYLYCCTGSASKLRQYLYLVKQVKRMRAGNVQELRVSICTVALATQANCGQYLYLVKQVKRAPASQYLYLVKQVKRVPANPCRHVRRANAIKAFVAVLALLALISTNTEHLRIRAGKCTR